jgi:site-specific DNA-methyltransferase (adenine-specific)
MPADYIQSNQPDILEVIANLSNDEIFTPPKVANAVLDLLPPEVWTDPSFRWLDPGCKTGIFPREITKRLMVGLTQVIPDESQRLDHILTKMVFAFAITELTGMMSRRTLYCSKDASGEFSAVRFTNPSGNIWHERVEHSFDDKGKCPECGGSRKQLESAGRDNYAYPFIHVNGQEKLKREIGMHFDVIVGNPPYQMEDGGNKASSSALYNVFVDQAKALNPKYLAMIIPSRWFAGGKGLDSFRSEMLADKQMRTLVDFTDASALFPGVDIAGGVCYFLWERDSEGPCRIVTEHSGMRTESTRFLNEYPTFIRFSEAIPIIEKVKEKATGFYEAVVSSRKPFGLDTTAKPDKKGDLTLYWREGRGPIGKDRVLVGLDMIPKWKVITSRTSYDHAGQHDKDGMRRVLSKLDIIGPNEVCSETYLVLTALDSKKQAEAVESYFRTRFARFLISLVSYTQDITKDRFAYVPVMNSDRVWNDKDLYRFFDLTIDERGFIESIIREMPV